MRVRVVPSLLELFYRLTNKATSNAIAAPAGEEGPGRFPVVVKPETRQFLEEQAKAFGSSIAGIAGALLDGIAMSEMGRDGPLLINAIAERFFIVLREHQLSFPAAAELLKPIDITLNDMAEMERLRAVLTAKNIKWIADHFHLNYDWLVGKSEFSADVKYHSWYKNEVGAARSLLSAVQSCDSAELLIICPRGVDLVNSKDDDGDWENAPHFIPIVIRRYSLPADESYETFEVWDEGRWSYWRCRHHIKLVFHFANLIENGKALNAIGQRVRFHLNGMYLPMEDYKKIRNSVVLPATLLSRSRHVDWYPSDFVESSRVQKDIEEWNSIKGHDENQATLQAFEQLLEKEN